MKIELGKIYVNASGRNVHIIGRSKVLNAWIGENLYNGSLNYYDNDGYTGHAGNAGYLVKECKEEPLKESVTVYLWRNTTNNVLETSTDFRDDPIFQAIASMKVVLTKGRFTDIVAISEGQFADVEKKQEEKIDLIMVEELSDDPEGYKLEIVYYDVHGEVVFAERVKRPEQLVKTLFENPNTNIHFLVKD